MSSASLYVDPIAVERATWGDRVYLRPLERRAAVWVLLRRGLGAKQIADRIGISDRTVHRHRARGEVFASAFGS